MEQSRPRLIASTATRSEWLHRGSGIVGHLTCFSISSIGMPAHSFWRVSQSLSQSERLSNQSLRTHVCERSQGNGTDKTNMKSRFNRSTAKGSWFRYLVDLFNLSRLDRGTGEGKNNMYLAYYEVFHWMLSNVSCFREQSICLKSFEIAIGKPTNHTRMQVFVA